MTLRFISIFSLLSCLLSLSSDANRPNILFFLVDDMGWQETSVPFHTEVTRLNREYRTPAMEQLAADGLVFTNAYATSVCSPTRVSLMTGQNAARHRVTCWTLHKDRSPEGGHKTLRASDWNLNGLQPIGAGVPRSVEAQTLPQLLRKAGYRTIHVGKAHFGAAGTPGADPRNLGFDVNIAGHAAGGPGSYHGDRNFSAAWRKGAAIWDVPGLDKYHGQEINLTEALTREAIGELEQSVAQGRPFFLHMSHYTVHAPWEADRRFIDGARARGLRGQQATLASMLESMDKSLGDLRAALDRLGVADNTIVVFMSDNGSPKQCPQNHPLRGHKISAYEGGARVPLIVHWPGTTKPATRTDTPVIIEDLFPTILGMAEVSPPDKQVVDGHSFLPTLEDPASPSQRPPLVWHYPNLYDQPPYSAIRHGDWKLIYWHATRRLELFNLREDIGETTDLAGEHPERLRELAAALGGHLRGSGADMPADKGTKEPVPMPDEIPPVKQTSGANTVDVPGTWSVRLDEADEGLDGTWFSGPLATDLEVTLPGSLRASGLGHPFNPDTGRYDGTRRPYLKWPAAGYTDATRADEIGALVPSRLYIGPAWFERIIEIPADQAGQSWRLTLERVKWTSHAWIDGLELDAVDSDSLHTPHHHLTPPLSAGPHRLTLRIDNRAARPIGLAGHGYGMETEPIWHGVAGTMRFESLDPAGIDQVRVRPGIDGSVEVEVTGHCLVAEDSRLNATVRSQSQPAGSSPVATTPLSFCNATPGQSAPFSTTITLQFPARPALWDEFHPNLYDLHLTVSDGDGPPSAVRTVRTGFRDLQRDGNRLLLNGTPLFLRGNLDCAIHPESDTPPTDRAWWERVLGIHKAAGFNHIRFHTWCPPEAAFAVADELGLYLQVETAYWVDNWIHDTAPHPPRIGEDPMVDAWVLAESRRIIDTYGHHPSFMMFCLGNEFGMGSDWDAIERIVADLRAQTGTILIAGTTARKTVDSDQYWVTHNSGAGTRGLGPAHSDWDFSPAVAATGKPVISHETGQRQSWPDYDALLPAFTGVMKPHNLARLRARAGAAGITDHRARAEASARFAHLLYKHEHEAMRRTAGLAGYQLLMLHDFTGQGEAHVGLLDPFFREKPGITLGAIRSWNGPTVPLARMRKFVWEDNETLEVDLELAHAGPEPLEQVQFTASLSPPEGAALSLTSFGLNNYPIGANAPLGSLRASLGNITEPTKLTLAVACKSLGISNSWPLWVYPAHSHSEFDVERPMFDARLSEESLAVLADGGTVLLTYHKASGDQFQQTRWGSTFWTGAWGWGSGLGLLCDPAHPALAGFPNDGHSDWQWQDLADGGTCIALPPEHAAKATIIEHLSTFHHPVRQAFLVEARVGKGRLLACGFDLAHDLERRPAARALRASLIKYAKSSSFNPALELTPAEAAALFATPAPLAAVARAGSEAPGFEAAMAIDGNPATFWHTRWGAIEPPHPHELVVEFQDARILGGIRLKNRADQDNGRPAEISLFLSGNGHDWGTPLVDHAKLENSAGWQTLKFAPTSARFLRLVTHREVRDRPFASLAELQPLPATPE